MSLYVLQAMKIFHDKGVKHVVLTSLVLPGYDDLVMLASEKGTYAHTHTHTHARTHPRTRTHTHTHTLHEQFMKVCELFMNILMCNNKWIYRMVVSFCWRNFS